MQLVAENLTLSRGGRTIFDGLSLRVGPGEALVLTGPNGSGKTTLLRALAGFLRPDDGTISIPGDEREPAELAHFVGHMEGVKAHLSVRENLTFWADYLDGTGGEDLNAAFGQFALSGLEDIPAGYLSAGQKRRLALARLAVAKRPMWLLDEPTVSLDTASVGLLMKAIEAHLADGGLAVIATHVSLGLANERAMRIGSAGAVQ
ncbi:MAG: heme ABC exporter ATP-binding protein CcmA [Porticoccaceae bacterium]|nr:heme ABC exporter ATP-binding protein CcmA [Porticoccaceae bacterium]